MMETRPDMERRRRGRRLFFPAACLAVLAGAAPAFAQSGETSFSSPVVLMIVMGTLSLAPFMLIMLTSFVKISVVLSIVRNALGTQQIPPNQVVTGLAFVLTIFIMLPVARDVYEKANISETMRTPVVSERTVRELLDGAQRGKEPVREFLGRFCHDKDRALFVDLARRLGNRPDEVIDPNGFQILIPAFVTSQLKEAFQIGFIIFIPFLIIDMVVANVLLSLGMMMLSPTTIALPFKILLFVLVDGWFLIVQGLVLGYLQR